MQCSTKGPIKPTGSWSLCELAECPQIYPARTWDDSSVGRALQRYLSGHRFESRSGLNFFQALIAQLLKLCGLHIYRLLTKREVKIAGYWPSSFFCVFMGRDEVEVHKHAKKNEANIQPC